MFATNLGSFECSFTISHQSAKSSSSTKTAFNNPVSGQRGTEPFFVSGNLITANLPPICFVTCSVFSLVSLWCIFPHLISIRIQRRAHSASDILRGQAILLVPRVCQVQKFITYSCFGLRVEQPIVCYLICEVNKFSRYILQLTFRVK